MKNWKLAYRVTFINCAIVIFIGLIIGIFSTADGFAFALGIICLGGGLLDLFLGFIIYLSGAKEIGKGFLNSAGILLLLSGISCGTGLEISDFH